MAKHLTVLVRLAGRTYRVLHKLTLVIQRFPLERFITAIELFIQWAEMQGLPNPAENQPQPIVANPPSEDAGQNQKEYEEEELMTIKETEAFIPASRTKIYKWRKEGKLQTVARSERDKRLIRTEVEAMKKWAIDKGKR